MRSKINEWEETLRGNGKWGGGETRPSLAHFVRGTDAELVRLRRTELVNGVVRRVLSGDESDRFPVLADL